MSIVVHKTKTPIYLRRSVHTPLYLGEDPNIDPEDWLINPSIPEGVLRKYLKVVNSATVEEMTQIEKDVVDGI